jgi:His-Xaa-Ser system protein HxsD
MGVFFSAEAASCGLGEKVLVKIDGNIHPKEAVLKAAYWATEHCHIRLVSEPDGTINAEIQRKDDSGAVTLATACYDFENALIDFTMRIRIASETRELHEALLKRAFHEALSKTG